VGLRCRPFHGLTPLFFATSPGACAPGFILPPAPQVPGTTCLALLLRRLFRTLLPQRLGELADGFCVGCDWCEREVGDEMFESFFSAAFVVGDLSERDVGARGLLLVQL